MKGVFVVIRDFKAGGTEELFHLINNIDTGYDIDNIKDLEKNATKFIVYEDDKISGLAYATISTNDANEQEAQVKIYVEPQSRRKGIGKALYNKLEAYLTELKPDLISAYIRVDIQNPSPFCNKIGFHKWWGSPELYYIGEPFPENDVEFSVYDDKYFKQFVKVNQECYYPLQKSNDLKPYIGTEEIIKEYKLNNKENVYLALDNDEIMASVTIGNGEIDNLIVSPKYQGKGYGKKALQFGMNQLLKKGHKEIRICFMENNTIAENLYYSLGYKFLQNTHVYRKFL